MSEVITASNKKIGKHYGDRKIQVGGSYLSGDNHELVFVSVVGDKAATTYGATAHFTPKRARQLAFSILDLADEIENAAGKR
jgi:hypothetical protein